MKKIIVLTGAGMSAESGISTFRDSGGLWEKYEIDDVATPNGWRRNQELVLDFYNQRRIQLLNSKPNDGHYALAELEKEYNVQIITLPVPARKYLMLIPFILKSMLATSVQKGINSVLILYGLVKLSPKLRKQNK